MSGWIKVARRASDSRTTAAGGAVACVTWAGAAASCATRPSSGSRRARGARCGGSLHLDRPCSTRRGGPSRPPLAQAFQDSQTGGRSQPATGAEFLRNVWVDPAAVARWFAGAPPAASMPCDRQKNDVRNGSLDGSPVRGPAGREPILFTLPFESSRLNGRKSRSGKSVPGSGRLRGISRPNTRSFFRPCLQRANGRTRFR